MVEKESKIRPMREDDWTEFEKIDAELFPDDIIEQESFIRIVEKGSFFAIESEGKIIGMLAVSRFGEDAGHLGRIGVSSSLQNRGLGARLMKHAIEWFRNEKIGNAILYTQDHNKHAQHLYKKFGFERVGITWHYFVPFKTITPTENHVCELIQEDEIETVGQKYHDYLPAAQIRRFLESENHHVFVLKNREGAIVGACRFTPSFPGCMPFRIESIDSLDDFLSGLKGHSLPEFDYIRLTFTDDEDLAELCDERGYKLHHRLYRMRAEVPPE